MEPYFVYFCLIKVLHPKQDIERGRHNLRQAPEGLVEHPAYDAYWQDQAVDRILAAKPLTVPTRLVDGQWDQEDIYGALAVRRALKAQSGGRLHFVLGPWYPGEENGDGSKLAVDWDRTRANRSAIISCSLP